MKITLYNIKSPDLKKTKNIQLQ